MQKQRGNAIIFHVFIEEVPHVVIEIPGIREAPVAVATFQKRVFLGPAGKESLAKLSPGDKESVYKMLEVSFLVGFEAGVASLSV